MKFRRLYGSEYSAYISKPPKYLEKGKGDYTKKAVAQVVNWAGKGEDTYIMYAYSTDELDYLFAWITPYDETHRAFGNHPGAWYDKLTQDTEFDVLYDQKKPWLHKVETSKFAQLNQCDIIRLAEK